MLCAPGNIDYSMSKRLVSFLSRGLAHEVSYSKKIDMMSFEPFGVVSNLVKTKPSRIIDSAEKASACALRDLGKEEATFGSLSHYM